MRYLKLLLGFLIAGLFVSCTQTPKHKLIVFAAGSLIKPFSELESAFERANPNIDVEMEFHGSIQVIRQVTDLDKKIDIVATADQALIPYLMYSKTDPATGKPYAGWHIKFASNKMALAYTSKSKYADVIDQLNWQEILRKKEVIIGLADPRFDASGYRSLMILKLSEAPLDAQPLFESIITDQFKYPIRVDSGGGLSIISIPEVLEPVPGSRIVIRGGSIQLLSLLESGNVDYAFEYESVIRQHNLKMIKLPDEINLGNPIFNDNYARVTVKLDFQRFASLKPVFEGQTIGYGLVIPENAQNPAGAEKFIEFMYGPTGQDIMKKNFHPLIDPPIIDNPADAPQSILSLSSHE